MTSEELCGYVEEVDKWVKRDGFHAKNINAYVQASKAFLSNFDDVPTAMELTRKSKMGLQQIVYNQRKESILDTAQTVQCLGVHVPEIDLMWECLRIESPFLFDSYMLFLEKNRQPKDKFYYPRRDCLQKLGIIQDLQDLEDDVLDIYSLSLPPGTGKAQPLYSKVLTPNGFIPMGEVRVGTEVIAGNGNVTRVIGVYPQGKKKVYELTFNDGSTCRCSENHLWTCQTRDDRRRGNKYRTVELADMMKNLYVESGKRANYSIDYAPAVDFSEREFYIHPYALGVLLGDGSVHSGLNVSLPDKEIKDRFESLLPDGCELVCRKDYDYRIKTNVYYTKGKSNYRKELERLGVFGKYSHTKHIPFEYMVASREQRLELLRGLMDTDGCVSKNIATYTTTSLALAEDVAELVHSLGGYASITDKETAYTKDGERIPCKIAYNVCIQFACGAEPIFHLPRKKDAHNPKRTEIKRFLKDVRYIGEEECQCIMVADDCHLYITDNYIVTHNTTLEKFFATWVIGRWSREYSLFFSHSDDITRMFYDGVLAITTDNMEYLWDLVFPNLKLRKTDAARQQIDFGKEKAFWSLQCSSRGSSNAGKVRASKYLYVDDLIGGIEEAMNPAFLDKLYRIYSTDAKQRKLNQYTKELHVATRWSTRDVIGRLQLLHEGNPRARFKAVPDIDPKTGKSNFNYRINGMNEEFFHDQELAMDDVTYRCLYKNEPIEREGRLYTEDNIMTYLTMPTAEPDAVLSIVDTKSKGTDFLVCPCFKQYGDKYYLDISSICTDSSDYGVQYERIARMYVSQGVQSAEFESNAGGDRVAFEVDKLVKEMGGTCNITTKFTETNKETRIIIFADWVKKHVYFPDKSLYNPKSDVGTFMYWLFAYTISGKNIHDDVPDCLANFAKHVDNMNRVARIEVPLNPYKAYSRGY